MGRQLAIRLRGWVSRVWLDHFPSPLVLRVRLVSSRVVRLYAYLGAWIHGVRRKVRWMRPRMHKTIEEEWKNVMLPLVAERLYHNTTRQLASGSLCARSLVNRMSSGITPAPAVPGHFSPPPPAGSCRDTPVPSPS